MKPGAARDSAPSAALLRFTTKKAAKTAKNSSAPMTIHHHSNPSSSSPVAEAARTASPLSAGALVGGVVGDWVGMPVRANADGDSVAGWK